MGETQEPGSRTRTLTLVGLLGVFVLAVVVVLIRKLVPGALSKIPHGRPRLRRHADDGDSGA
jgi:hypothetical protein